MDPIPLQQLDAKDDGDSIRCVQGKIISLFEPKRGEGKYGPWVLQNGTIAQDGIQHRICFADEGVVLDPEKFKNKLVRITAGAGSKGKLRGVTMDVGEYKGEPTRTIKVSSGARVELVEGEQTPTQPTTKNFSVKAPAPVAANVDRRIALYYDVWERVCAQFAGSPVQLSPSDLKDITTHICLTFKGWEVDPNGRYYAGYGEPIFDGAPPEAKPEPETTAPENYRATAEHWSVFEHKGKTLSEFTEEEIKDAITWAFSVGPKPITSHANELVHHLFSAAKELKFSPKVAFMRKLESAFDGEEENVINEALKEFFLKNFHTSNPTNKEFAKALSREGLEEEIKKILADTLPF